MNTKRGLPCSHIVSNFFYSKKYCKTLKIFEEIDKNIQSFDLVSKWVLLKNFDWREMYGKIPPIATN